MVKLSVGQIILQKQQKEYLLKFMRWKLAHFLSCGAYDRISQQNEWKYMQIKCRAGKSGGIKIRHSFGVFLLKEYQGGISK